MMCTWKVGLRLAALAGCLLIAGGPARAADWPRFRGPNGTGVAEDKNIPVQWTDKNILWKVELPGTGNSSPVIWGERIFLQTADSKTRQLLCLSAVDGKMLWSQVVPGSRARTHEKSSLASSTPATDGERVYAVFWDGERLAMTAHDFQGNQVWRRDLGTYVSQHGAGCSPIVHDGKVYFTNDQDNASTLLCLDAKDGKDVWQVKRPAFEFCSYATPFFLEKKGTPPQLIVGSMAGISSYNPQDGSENWHFTWKFDGRTLRTVSSPIFSQGLVFATSGEGGGARHAIAVKAEGKGDVSETNLAWENKKSLPYVPGLLARGDYLYYIHDKGIAGCLVARTGEEVWNQRLAGADMTASPILIDGKVYAVSEKGDVFVFAAEPKFKLFAKNPLNELVRASPAVANGRLFIRGQTHLFCIGEPAGK